MNTMQDKHCCTTPAMSGKTIVRENCVHADVVRVFCALLEKICLFVNFLPDGFYSGLVYCSVVSAFVPHLEFLFLLVQGSAIVCFFGVFLLLLFLRSQCVERCRLVIIMKFTMQGQSISA